MRQVQKKKILLFFPGLSLYQDPDTWASRLSTLKQNFELGILGLSFPQANYRSEIEGVPIFEFGHRCSYENSLMRNLIIIFSIGKALCLYYTKRFRFDGILVFNPLMSGLIGLVISLFTGARLICEINGNYKVAFKYGEASIIKPTLGQKLKEFLSSTIISTVIKKADAIRLLYPSQLDPLGVTIGKSAAAVCHEFVPVQQFLDKVGSDGKYILFVGYPFYLKGVDVLIKAFQEISPLFPDYTLKIVGYCPKGREYFNSLAAGNSKIEFHKPVTYDVIKELMAKCTFFVLPSRTEAMGRVLIEAMAAGKPVIGSNIDGIPYVIKNGDNGFLFELEDAHDLAMKMIQLLKDKALYQRMCARAKSIAEDQYSESRYGERYCGIIKSAFDRTTPFEDKVIKAVEKIHHEQNNEHSLDVLRWTRKWHKEGRSFLTFYSSRDDKSLYFVKISMLPHLGYANEAAMLKLVRKSELIAATVPEVFEVIESNQQSALIERAVYWPTMRSPQLESSLNRMQSYQNVSRVFKWWQMLVRECPFRGDKNIILSQMEEVKMAYLQSYGDNKYFYRLREIVNNLNYLLQKNPILSVIHGDLWRENIWTEQDRIFIFDWERAKEGGFPLLDYFLFASTLVDDCSIAGMKKVFFESNWLSRLVGSYLAQAIKFLSLSESDAKDLFYYFLFIMSSQTMRTFGTKSQWDKNWYLRLEYVLENELLLQTLFAKLSR